MSELEYSTKILINQQDEQVINQDNYPNQPSNKMYMKQQLKYGYHHDNKVSNKINRFSQNQSYKQSIKKPKQKLKQREQLIQTLKYQLSLYQEHNQRLLKQQKHYQNYIKQLNDKITNLESKLSQHPISLSQLLNRLQIITQSMQSNLQQIKGINLKTDQNQKQPCISVLIKQNQNLKNQMNDKKYQIDSCKLNIQQLQSISFDALKISEQAQAKVQKHNQQISRYKQIIQNQQCLLFQIIKHYQHLKQQPAQEHKQSILQSINLENIKLKGDLTISQAQKRLLSQNNQNLTISLNLKIVQIDILKQKIKEYQYQKQYYQDALNDKKISIQKIIEQSNLNIEKTIKQSTQLYSKMMDNKQEKWSQRYEILQNNFKQLSKLNSQFQQNHLSGNMIFKQQKHEQEIKLIKDRFNQEITELETQNMQLRELYDAHKQQIQQITASNQQYQKFINLFRSKKHINELIKQIENLNNNKFDHVITMLANIQSITKQDRYFASIIQDTIDIDQC